MLSNVRLSIAPGSFAGLVGRNGAGKTTLMRAIMGLLPIHAGNLNFLGTDLRASQPQRRAGFGIGYMPEDRSIPELTVQENVLNRMGDHDEDAAERLDFVWNPSGGTAVRAAPGAPARADSRSSWRSRVRSRAAGACCCSMSRSRASRRRLHAGWWRAIAALRATGVSVLLESDYAFRRPHRPALRNRARRRDRAVPCCQRQWMDDAD